MIRKLLFVCLCFGASFSSSSFAAEPIPATKETAAKVQRWETNNGTLFPVMKYQVGPATLAGGIAACKAFKPPGSSEYLSFSINSWNDAGNCIWRSDAVAEWIVQFAIEVVQGCPSGYADVSGVCEKWVCPTGYTGPTMKDNVRVCDAPNPCEAREGIKQDQYVPVPLGGTYCNGTCEYTLQLVLEIGGKNNADDSHYTDFTANGVRWTYGTFRQMWPGKQCTAVKSPGDGPPGDKPPVPRKKPPCADGEGVLTTTAGHVGCVPEGVPDARKPVVNKEKKEEVYPDGSKKETETVKTKDPKTGATDVSQNTTATAGPGGGTQAGPPGSSSSNGSSSGTGGDGKGGEGCDPTLNFCGGPDVEALYEKKEKTFQSSLDTFKGTVSGSPVGQASTQFFQVSAPGGGCPGWVVTVPFINVTLNASEFFCNSSIMAALDGAGAVMLALATYIAFTWAFL